MKIEACHKCHSCKEATNSLVLPSWLIKIAMKPLMKLGAMLLIILCTFSCKDSEECGPALEDPACVCPEVYDPVCGCDGITYSNACVAECHNIKAYSEGACPE